MLRLEPRSQGLAIVFEGGGTVERAALFFASGCRQRSPLAERLGCKVGADGLIETEDNQAAGVAGVLAGDASRSALLAIVAAGEGAAAALAINKELLREDLGA